MTNKKYFRQGRRKEIVFRESDWAIIEAKAKEMNVDTTKYITRAAVSGNVRSVDFKGLSDLSTELRSIGNNINQLARKANEINNIYANDYDEMRKEYFRLCRILNQRISEELRSVA